MSAPKPSRGRQIAGIKLIRDRNVVSKMQRSKELRESEATEVALCLDATIHTLEVVQKFDPEITAVVSHLRRAEKAGQLDAMRRSLLNFLGEQ